MGLKPTDVDLKIVDDKPLKATSLTVAMELYSGGDWLGASRAWMQSNLPRGDQISWGDNQQRFEITPKQLENISYRVAVAAVVADRRERPVPDFVAQTVIHFSLLCRGAISDREGARKREYKVDVYAPSLERAKQAYLAQTAIYEAEFVSVAYAEIQSVDALMRTDIKAGLLQHNGAFLLENLSDW